MKRPALAVAALIAMTIQASAVVLNVDSCEVATWPRTLSNLDKYDDDHIKNWLCRVGRAAVAAMDQHDTQATDVCVEAMGVLTLEFTKRFPGQDARLVYNSASKLC